MTAPRPLLLALLFVAPLTGCDQVNDLIAQLTGQTMTDGGPPVEEGCVDDNFSVATAGTIAPGTQVDALLCPLRDNDFWRFTVSESGQLVRVHLWMDTNLTPVEPGYTILTGDDVPTGISGTHEGRTAGEPVDFEGVHPLAPGDYVLRIADVEGFDDNFDDLNPYHLTIELIPDPDPSEPNEGPDEATPLVPGETTAGLIGTTGDHDWYAVPVEADGQLFDLQLRAPLDIGLDLRVEVVAPNQLNIVDSLLALSNGAELNARTRRAVSGAPGDVYYVHVFDEGGQANADTVTGTYELVVQVSADPDVNEQNGGNNLVEDATPLAADTPVTATLAAVGDQDIYRVEVPAGSNPTTPKVLVVDLAFTGGVPADVQPQLLLLTANPERGPNQIPPCGDGCPVCVDLENGGTGCGEAYLQRVLDGPSYTTAFPLRRTRPVYIAINDFGDDGYLEADSYTVSYTVVEEPDPGEAGDDYLIPNLQTAAYDNDDELQNQYNLNRERARNINQPFLEACDLPEVVYLDAGPEIVPPPDPCADAGVADLDGGVDGGACVPPPPPNCEPVTLVPNYQGQPMEPFTVECTDQDWTVTANGRLTYEGDRDFFRFNVPHTGYWSLDVDYDVSSNTPVELTVFFHDSDKLIGAFLEATETQGNCMTSTECPLGSVCIDGSCWADDDNNNAFTGHVFPNANQCLYVHTNFTERPLYIEVTDNGINDFDLDMAYELRVRIRCGCPAACDATGPAPQCQGVAPPQ